ncbi:MAG: D-alanyl-D-alanine carboxypeptidase/D-alanyl-D-alanine endopeptidase [Planctomycetota bacterium]|jgi:D-alanyl-D-alanine carboxypeptidase/D-alanyl-D-alanine-endopeptidase (penicillin-binding protein 4)
MKTQIKKLVVAAVFALCLGSFAKADLANRIDAIVSQPSQRKVQFSIHIVKADSGSMVYSHKARELMIPASNMKIIVTAAALKYLGPGYEYKTKVGLCGDTLVIIGSGDPLLGDEKTDAKYGRERGWIFKDIAALLKRNRTETIEDIVVDSSVFDDQRVHPSWPREELNRWYACEVSGLNFNDNCIAITTKNTGGRVAVSIEPRTSFLKLINKVVPISKGSSAVGTYRNREPNKLTVRGKCKDRAGPFDVAIERPAAFFGFLLAENLAKEGINIKGQLIEKTLDDYSNFKLLAEYTTPIADCLARCNKNSLGLAAEALLKTIAATNNPDGKNGSWDRGRELIGEYLLALGIGKSQFYIDDGSGLSRQNELSAYAITTVLLNTYKSRYWQLYRDSLAAGGVDGTIARYFKEQKYKGKILGKTGYISGVKSFSGLCSTEAGDYIFSILTNKTNGNTRKAVNDIAKAIIDDVAFAAANLSPRRRGSYIAYRK